ncbi:MAG: DUF2752 domain-containing protein [Anaerolineae bacterium]|nr:DUF2752 domain-containing protein [Anaerolineae bacterium]
MLQNASSLPLISQLKGAFSNPILTPILESRAISLAIVGAAMLHAGLTILGLPGWPCPAQQLGFPCPGCGLSRAIAVLLHGHWQTSLTLHAFAPFFLLALITIAGVSVLPASQKHSVVSRIEIVERHTGIVGILLLGLVFYWLIRLLFFREAFFNLIMG